MVPLLQLWGSYGLLEQELWGRTSPTFPLAALATAPAYTIVTPAWDSLSAPGQGHPASSACFKAPPVCPTPCSRAQPSPPHSMTHSMTEHSITLSLQMLLPGSALLSCMMAESVTPHRQPNTQLLESAEDLLHAGTLLRAVHV